MVVRVERLDDGVDGTGGGADVGSGVGAIDSGGEAPSDGVVSLVVG